MALKAALGKGVWAGPALGAGAQYLTPVNDSHSHRIGMRGWAGEQAVSGAHAASGSSPAPRLWLKRPGAAPGCLPMPCFPAYTSQYPRGPDPGQGSGCLPGPLERSASTRCQRPSKPPLPPAPIGLSHLHQARPSSARTARSLTCVSENLFPESTPVLHVLSKMWGSRPA